MKLEVGWIYIYLGVVIYDLDKMRIFQTDRNGILIRLLGAFGHGMAAEYSAEGVDPYFLCRKKERV